MSVFDERDLPACQKTVKHAAETLCVNADVRISAYTNKYVALLRYPHRSLSWRSQISPIVREARNLIDVSVRFCNGSEVDKMFETAHSEDELVVALSLVREKARTLGSRPPAHEGRRPKKVSFTRCVAAAVAADKNGAKLPPKWALDSKVLQDFVQTVYNDAAKVYVDEFKLASEAGKPHEVILEGLIEEVSQSMLEAACFGNEKLLKEVVCDVGRSEENRRLTVTLCGAEVSPFVLRNDYKK